MLLARNPSSAVFALPIAMEAERERVVSSGKRMNQRAIEISASFRRVSWLLAALGLAVVLITIAVGITASRRQAEHQILTNLQARGASSAGFVSTFLSEQADRELQTARALLAGRETSSSRFSVVVSSFGSRAAVLLDRSGRVLEVAPSDPKLLGADIASRYAHLHAAEAGHTAVSGVVPSAVKRQPIVAIAVPYSTESGRRVLSLAYPVARTVLAALVAHAAVLKPHQVVLIDATGTIIASNPALPGLTVNQADPKLAAAIAHSPRGTVRLSGAAASYVMVPVAGTSWHLVIAIPNSRLFVSIDGSAHWLPWIVFSALGLFGLLALALFARSLSTTHRLAAISGQLARAARTDTVTGLLNRRALEERLAHAAAHARRHGEPLSALMIDLDHFKHFNDNYGHETGDHILNLVADTMRAVFRESDIFGRWGGDEFLALLPATDHHGARDVSRRLREHARAIDTLPEDVTQPITLSVGAATTVDATPDDLLRQADIALYRVKDARAEPAATLALN
jgi:diguanylate cyclase (GGDEF)-like protein